MRLEIIGISMSSLSFGIYIYAKPKSQREKDYIQPDTGSIVIDEPDNGDYDFHFE